MPREERLQTVPYGEVFLPKERVKKGFPLKDEDEKPPQKREDDPPKKKRG